MGVLDSPPTRQARFGVGRSSRSPTLPGNFLNFNHRQERPHRYFHIPHILQQIAICSPNAHSVTATMGLAGTKK